MEIGETILNVCVVAAILVSGAVFTQWFTKRMYYTCAKCGTLNAKRRSQCRQCGAQLPG